MNQEDWEQRYQSSDMHWNKGAPPASDALSPAAG
jgi:hypothetical protein